MRVRFGEFALDLEARELTRDGRRLALSPKAFRLLETLVSGRPRALARAELADRLWPGTAMGYTSLAGAMAELRRVLGEDPREPRYLRTVHGHGYAFCGQVVDEPDPAPRPRVHCAISWEGRVIGLPEGESLIGRDEGCALRIDAPRVSRRHARVVVRGPEARIEDLGSKNGILVGGRKITGPVPLEDGDVIELGGARFTFHSAYGPGSTLSG